MRVRFRRSGWRVLVPLAAAALAAASLSTGSAFGVTSYTTTAPLARDSISPFSCDASGNPPGNGTSTFKQTGSLLTFKFKLTNVPANSEFDVEIVECSGGAGLTLQDLGSVISDSKGVATGSFSTTIVNGRDHYYLCIDNGRTQWGTDPLPIY